jgi:REP element-mobilizing transposase RayT
MILNDFGRIVHDEWMRSATIRKEIELDEFIVMPNHFHAIVLIHDCRGDRPVAPTETNRPVARKLPNGPKPKSIGSLIAGFKSSVTKQINSNRNKPGEPLWQRNYYERILRNEDALYITRRYILNNPKNWIKDDFNH